MVQLFCQSSPKGENRMKKSRWVLCILLLLFGCGCLFLAEKKKEPFAEAKKKGEVLKEIAVPEEPADAGERRIDFAALKKINPDIVGWLYLPQIGVDGPILTGQTDETYLAHDFEGNASELGSIFTFADAKLSDSQVYLFAHNMASGQMFGSLKKFQDPDFQKEYPEGCLYTPERTKRFRITGWEYKEAEDPCFAVREQKDAGISFVTCVGYFRTTKRLVVHAEITEEQLTF